MRGGLGFDGGGMLKWIEVRDFRCFESARVELDAETTVFVGRNGQGKTSLIEAACLLMRLQSPRTSSRADLVRFGAAAGVVTGAWQQAELRCAVSAKLRRLAVDGAVCSRVGDYLALSGVVVWMDHADMNLLRGGGDCRRRYLDFAASQLFGDYLTALRNYERALRGRNYVLKRDAVISWREADAYGRVLGQQGRVLMGRRAELCELLREPVAGFHGLVGGEQEVASLGYVPGGDAEHLEEELLARREEEARLRSTVCGPHRDDLELLIQGVDATRFASEGQQRTLALAMKLGQARVLADGRGVAPLLLVDDVFGELDVGRRRAFLDCLPVGTQKLLTTTRLDWLREGQQVGRVYEVQTGRLSGISL
jgi:DNA replication and repair protein RecF